MKMIIKPIARFHNWLSDKDFIWWPFSFLRPEAKIEMDMKLVFQMTACFGGLSFFMLSGFQLANNALDFSTLIGNFFFCTIGFGTWFSLVTKPLWNVRARELKKGHPWP